MKNYNLSETPGAYGLYLSGCNHYKKNIVQAFKRLKLPQNTYLEVLGTLVPEPNNPHDKNAIAVHLEGKVIGYIPADLAARYGQLKRVIASGYTPVMKMYTQTGPYKHYFDRHFSFKAMLPRPGSFAPLNDPPYGEYVVIPEGKTRKVTKETDHQDILLDYLPPSGHGIFYVTLHLFRAGANSKYDGVAIHLDGERVGELSRATSKRFSPMVRHLEDIGVTPVAIGHLSGTSLLVELNISAKDASEISESILEPPYSHLPKLVTYEVDPDDYDVDYSIYDVPFHEQRDEQDDDFPVYKSRYYQSIDDDDEDDKWNLYESDDVVNEPLEDDVDKGDSLEAGQQDFDDVPDEGETSLKDAEIEVDEPTENAHVEAVEEPVAEVKHEPQPEPVSKPEPQQVSIPDPESMYGAASEPLAAPYVPPVNYSSPIASKPQPTKKAPRKWLVILSWASIAFAGMFLISAFSETGFKAVIGTIIASLAFALPGSWYLLHASREKDPNTQPLNRHWGPIWVVTLILFAAGGMMLPSPTDETSGDSKTTTSD